MLAIERARMALAAFRRSSALRLRAARLYRLGAEVLGELSPDGRERWIRGRSPGGPTIERLSRLPDDEVRANARALRERAGLVVAPDCGDWIRSPRLGPELPPSWRTAHRH